LPAPGRLAGRPLVLVVGAFPKGLVERVEAFGSEPNSYAALSACRAGREKSSDK